jgi:hypothetical protein
MIHTVSTNMQCNPISSAGINLVSCDKIFILPGGTTINMHNCGSYGSGDTIMLLYDGDGVLVGWNDDGCESGAGGGSSISYTIPSSAPVQPYTTYLQCYDEAPCSGDIQIGIQCNHNNMRIINHNNMRIIT